MCWERPEAAHRLAFCHLPPLAPTNPLRPLTEQAYDNAKSIKGKSQAAVLAAIVFLACRHTGNARTFKEICAVVPQASVKVTSDGRSKWLGLELVGCLPLR